ncbi:hypothetical protein F4604DRAFT_1730671 [Suillus subluteus]|nr:hypothetical protein F4604DRAFT_1730671 [Suillus subluteus]
MLDAGLLVAVSVLLASRAPRTMRCWVLGCNIRIPNKGRPQAQGQPGLYESSQAKIRSPSLGQTNHVGKGFEQNDK